MNKIELTGRLTRDPDLRYTPNNRPIAQFTIAVNRRYAKETDEIKADFFPIVVWGKQGENCKTYLLKGSMVGIIGTLRNRSYEKDGNTRYITEVIAEEVEFLTPKKTTDNSNNETIPGEEHTPYDYQEEQASIYDNEFQLNDDDLPF
jgi:single-strand DNA-binding protein